MSALKSRVLIRRVRVVFVFELRALRAAIINKQCAKRMPHDFDINGQKDVQSYHRTHQLMSSIDLALFYPVNSQATRVARETDRRRRRRCTRPRNQIRLQKRKARNKACLCVRVERIGVRAVTRRCFLFRFSRRREFAFAVRIFTRQSTKVCLSWRLQNVYLKIQVET